MSDIPLSTAASLYDAVRAIEGSRRRIAVVVDESGRLLGTLTDGDIRRCLLSGGTLGTPAAEAMNRTPLSAQTTSSESHVLELMRSGNVLCIPIVDAHGVFQRLVHLRDLDLEYSASTPGDVFEAAVIMAGGEGARLRPLTDSIPKPMVDIGGAPLLERQIQRLAHVGVKRVYISVNYLSHVIENHFGSGEQLGVQIHYLRETRKMGTAGALSLLPVRPERPIVVMNGDIVTTSDFANLFGYHRDQGCALTVAAVDYRVNIPYGVIQAEGADVVALQEKPSQRFLCNAGIYALSPETLSLIPRDRFYDMPDLIADCLAASRRVAVFPIHEYWSDIGTADDLEKTRSAFARMAGTA